MKKKTGVFVGLLISMGLMIIGRLRLMIQ